ncbi:MAG: hypothetical protein ACKVQA_06130 [Burkholderiales bacterium]
MDSTRHADVFVLGFQAIALSAAWRAATPAGWLIALTLVTGLGAFIWHRGFRRLRAIADTPTSKIASAALGYVELFGQSASLPGRKTRSQLTNLPCVWFRYTVEQRRNNKWVRTDSGESREEFLLRDTSGSCVIVPEHAEVIASRKDRWTRNDYRFTEYLLLENDKLYALGELTAPGGAGEALDPRRDTGILLDQWKRDPPALLTRFDLNGDGEIGLREWELARLAARREVRQQHDIVRSQPGTLTLRKPRDGKPYLLTNLAPEQLAKRFSMWGRVHASTVLCSGIGALHCLSYLGFK